MDLVPSLVRRENMHEVTPRNFPATEYLPIKVLSERIGYAVKTIYNLVSQDTFKEGIHYFKPTKRKLLFYCGPLLNSGLGRGTMETKGLTRRVNEAGKGYFDIWYRGTHCRIYTGRPY